MRKVLALLAALTVTGFTSPPPATTQQAGPPRAVKVIVNADNPVGLLKASDISKLFLRKTPAWYDGQVVMPVDQPEGSSLRAAFVREIHQKPSVALKAYWQQQIFAGRATPPVELPSDAEVMDYVRQHPTAIGYVSAAAQLTPDLKPITILH